MTIGLTIDMKGNPEAVKMNRHYKSIFNAAIGAWMAVGETARSCAHGKGHVGPGMTLAIMALLFNGSAQAACSPPSGTATAGATITCTGVTTGQYTINAASTTFNNQGDLAASGSLLGVLYALPTTASGFQGINTGSITWTNAQYGGGGTGTRAAVNASFITSNNWTAATSFLNDTTGSVTVDISSTLSNNRSIAGIATLSRYNLAGITNKGTVSVDSASTNALSYAIGVVSAGKSVNIANSGSVVVNANSGASASGISINGIYTTGYLSMENSGSVVVSSKGDWVTGLEISPLTASATAAQIANSGVVEIKGGATYYESRSAVLVDATASLAIPVIITNTESGTIKADAFGNMVVLNAADTNTTLVRINNAGIITGGIYAVKTRAGNDVFTQTGGSTSGTIDLGNGDNAFLLSGGTMAGNLVTGSGNDVYAISGGLHQGDTNLSSGNDTLTASGGAIIGRIFFGNGNDELTIQGTADIAEATLLDGGNSTDSSVTDILGTSGAATNKLGFIGTTQSLAGSTLKNWQTVTLDGSNLTFSREAALVTGTGVNSDGSPQGLALMNASTLTSPVALAVTGDVNIDATSILNHSLGGSITGDVTNAGLINWQNPIIGQTLTVNGNYTGAPGSRLSLSTYLADDSSPTDKLRVTGNTAGSSALTVRPASGSPGAQTTNGIEVVQVEGLSTAGSFTLASPVQAGAYEYVLRQGGAVTGGRSWYLTSTYDCTLNGSCPTDPTTPTDPANPGGPDGPAIYRPGIANYVAGQSVNAEQGLLQLSTYHQRLGEQRAADGAGRETWLRPYYVQQSADGRKRFDYDTHIAGLQLGQEVWLARSDDGGARRAAITLDYAKSDARIGDALRPLAELDKDTGSLDAHSVALGGTFTFTDGQGGYLDLVGQISSLRNHYRDSYGDKALQKGQRTAFSIEAGKPVARLGDWRLEPQAQFIYMNTRYRGFDDATSHVDGYTAEVVRGRIGARLFTDTEGNNGKGTHCYALANVLHDFNTPEKVEVDDTKVSERYSRTQGEIGAGFQHRWRKDAWAYADARYRQSLDGQDAHGYQINLGVRIAF